MASTTDRGYGNTHQQLRDQWRPVVNAGEAHCHAVRCLLPTRWIQPGEPWDLGHTPDRSAYTGPEHRSCNRSEGARRGNAQRRRSGTLKTSRKW